MSETESVPENVSCESKNLLYLLTKEELLKLEDKFNTETSLSLKKEDFFKALEEITGEEKYAILSLELFEEICQNQKTSITWLEFLNFFLDQKPSTKFANVDISGITIDQVTHTHRESVAKIVLIETDQYFAYCVVSRFGRVGLYDGNLSLLTTYHVVMGIEDISTKEEPRKKRKNKWITDVLFCPVVKYLFITSSTRNLSIYDALNLNHTPLWIIISTPNIVQSMASKFDKENQQFDLFLGISTGQILKLKFLQAKGDFLKKKHNDKMSVFFWLELDKESEFLEVQNLGNIHEEAVLKLQYLLEENALLSCSKTPETSMCITFLNNKKAAVKFGVLRGISAFSYNKQIQLLAAGSSNGLIRIWNILLPKEPIQTLMVYENQEIVDLVMLPNQKIILSITVTGILQVCDILESQCIRCIPLKFPAFKEAGKIVEWGTCVIYPGPKRHQQENINENILAKEDELEKLLESFTSTTSFSSLKSTSKNVSLNKQKDVSYLDLWERSYIIIICCNFWAKLNLKFKNVELQKSLKMPIFCPPPVQNSVLIPKEWNLHKKVPQIEETTRSKNENHSANVEHLNFILNKNLLEENSLCSDINLKIAQIESEKLRMQVNVARGAPHLALKIHEITPILLPQQIPLYNDRIRRIFEKTQKLLTNAHEHGTTFSEQASTASKSPKSSSVEFL